jgi:hypothetical protein
LFPSVCGFLVGLSKSYIIQYANHGEVDTEMDCPFNKFTKIVR